ncbi:hypothetical protein CHO01_36990 [Cellulomonas hominis]|uniref:Uncharacterized protein with von Willebrand factor type A (VWA) domain n=1 Tax=Cellulomonas hominis TaxID=156981 RepID=A0A511FH97_9CELL|nr:hypothetical protein [Cellulomonas hominis]MBB5474715.1 uncharacterized protein with von Willebrand factor type A (vWA) domain [Cellulomonas hominis]NKY05980.1 hypothetical protein [Cellulomonas hominis]GEL48583.1 hypothetical protein CHO01_36990 [Cellulomonas hominis]
MTSEPDRARALAHALAGTTFTLLTAACSPVAPPGSDARRIRQAIIRQTPRVLADLTAGLDVRLPPLGGGEAGMRRAIRAVGLLTERAHEAGLADLAGRAGRFLARAHADAQEVTGEKYLRPYVFAASEPDTAKES